MHNLCVARTVFCWSGFVVAGCNRFCYGAALRCNISAARQHQCNTLCLGTCLQRYQNALKKKAMKVMHQVNMQVALIPRHQGLAVKRAVRIMKNMSMKIVFEKAHYKECWQEMMQLETIVNQQWWSNCFMNISYLCIQSTFWMYMCFFCKAGATTYFFLLCNNMFCTHVFVHFQVLCIFWIIWLVCQFGQLIIKAARTCGCRCAFGHSICLRLCVWLC